MTRARRSARKAAPGREHAPASSRDLRSIPGYLAAEGPPELDRLVHERVRLGMLSILAVNASLSFNELKELLHATDGNLSVHARKLEDAGYVACRKTFQGRVPRTAYRLTATGRQALTRYLDHMEALIRAMR